jgi:hypothetical protein
MRSHGYAIPANGAGDEARHLVPPLLRRWVLAFVGGEIVGFGLAAPVSAIGIMAVDAVHGPVRALAVIAAGVAAGIVEGGVVGWAQWRVLREPLPAVGRRAWIGATAATAALAWTVGMSLGTLAAPESEPPFAIVAVGAAAFGAVVGALLGAGQALVLREHVRHPERWVLANSLGWTIGMVVAFGGGGLVGEGVPVAAIVVVAALTGAVMALAPAVATGQALLAYDGQSGATGSAPPLEAAELERRVARMNRLNRLANPVMRSMLGSPFHRLLSGRLMLVTLTSPKSGRTVTFPVGYVCEGDVLAVISYRTRTWWHAVEGGHPVTLTLRGRSVPATGVVVTDEAAVAEALPRLARLLGRRRLSAEEAAARAKEIVIVRFRVAEA